MFHKPIKKELAALVETKKPKYRLQPKSKSNANGSPKPDSPSDTNAPNGSGTSMPTPSSSSAPLRPKSGSTTRDADDEFIPSGKHTDFQIISTPKQTWKYNVMKFAESRDKEVELLKWRQPIKLNRKDYRLPERTNGGSASTSALNGSGVATEGEDIKKTPMLGPDGKPVIGPDGRIVMVGPDGKVVPSTGSGATSATSKSSSKAATPNGKGKSKGGPRKKIKQVYLVPEEVRKLRREERYPWVIEEGPSDVKPGMPNDSNPSPTPTVAPGQVWVGHLENPEKNQTHGLLIPEGSTFRFVPTHRFYKFTKRRNDVFGPEEAEAEYAKLQKSKDPAQLWKRRKAALSEATLSTLKSESQSLSQSFSIKSEDGDGDDLNGQLRTVDAGGDDLFGGGDDEEEDKILRKRRDRDLGQEGDLDEMEYEEDFADDDEKIEMDGDDEELKEMEERLKREYRSANKARDATVDDNDEEEDMEEINHLTGAGRDLKKLVKRTEKNEAYESDDDEGNPYASEEEEEEQPPPPVLDGPAVMNQQQQQPSSSGNATPVPATGSASGTPPPRLTPTPVPVAKPKQLPHAASYIPKPTSPSSSRPGSPLAGGLAPGMGNAIVAKRATSPKVGKTRPLSGGVSIPGGARSPSPSPLGGTGPSFKAGTSTPPAGGRSPVASRAGSPVPISTTGVGMNLKRKATDDGPVSPVSPTAPTSGDPSAANRPHKKSKRPPTGTLDEAMIINFLRERKDATTKDCIQRFHPYLRGEETKKAFIAMVRKVAIVRNNILILRDEYA